MASGDGAGGQLRAQCVGALQRPWQRVGLGRGLLERNERGQSRRRERENKRRLYLARRAWRSMELRAELPSRCISLLEPAPQSQRGAGLPCSSGAVAISRLAWHWRHGASV